MKLLKPEARKILESCKLWRKSRWGRHRSRRNTDADAEPSKIKSHSISLH